MSRPKTTQDLYGDAYRRLDAMHAGIRRFRAEVDRVKDVFARPAAGSCFSLDVAKMESGSGEDATTTGDCRCRPLTPQPIVETGLEEFRLVLSAIRSITL